MKCCIPIENSLSGLVSYLTAPNIRNKIRHPLFFAMKFSNVFKIYLSKNIQDLPENEVIARIHELLEYSLCEERIRRFDHRGSMIIFIDIQNFQNIHLFTKIIEAFARLKSSVISFTFQKKLIDENFKAIIIDDNTINYYRIYYEKFIFHQEKNGDNLGEIDSSLEQSSSGSGSISKRCKWRVPICFEPHLKFEPIHILSKCYSVQEFEELCSIMKSRENIRPSKWVRRQFENGGELVEALNNCESSTKTSEYRTREIINQNQNGSVEFNNSSTSITLASNNRNNQNKSFQNNQINQDNNIEEDWFSGRFPLQIKQNSPKYLIREESKQALCVGERSGGKRLGDTKSYRDWSDLNLTSCASPDAKKYSLPTND